MSQETMNIALPDAMKEFVLQLISEGNYSTASEYVRDLIRADQKRRADDRLEALLLEGLDSKSAPMTKADWKAIREEVAKRVQQKKRQ